MQRMSSLTIWSIILLIIVKIPAIASATTSYQSTLTTSSSKYRRPGGTIQQYYYEALSINSTKAASVTFKSSSKVDIYGYLYENSFDPSNPSLNLLAQNDDSGTKLQFKLTFNLAVRRTYILVVTTYGSNVYGSFTITASSTTGTVSMLLIPKQIKTTTTTTTTTSKVLVTGTEESVSMTSSSSETSTIDENPIRTSQSIGTTTTTNPFVCSRPSIALIPEGTTLNAPVQFRRFQDISISSNIGLSCPLSLAIRAQWIISNCTSNCSDSFPLDRSVVTTSTELFIPARILDYGIYQLQLTVAMIALPTAYSSAIAYIKITPSGITANLVRFGTSIITSGHEKDLILDPGTYSIDPDQDKFDANAWSYAYYCRPYDLYQTVSPGPLQSIDQTTHPCFSVYSSPPIANRTAVQYNLTAIARSSVTILAGSLASNSTYQFVVFMINRHNPSIQAVGYLLVQVVDTQPQFIAVACVISTLCSANHEYQFINPTTQVALFSLCTGDCSSLMNIIWNIYQGWFDVSTNAVTWSLSDNWHDDQVFGMNTNNFTVINSLFLDNPDIFYWRFEVLYIFPSEISSSALNFRINQPPENGSCSLDPLNGTTSTIFTIRCSNWFDGDGIQDYSFSSYTTDLSKRTILGSTIAMRTQLRLPAGDRKTAILNIVVTIRDSLHCMTEYMIHSVYVQPDIEQINALVDILQKAEGEQINMNPFIQALAGGNQNTVGQILTSIAQVFNQMNKQNTDTAVSNGIPFTSISVTPLGSSSRSQSSALLNVSILNGYKQQLNRHADARDYLMPYVTNLQITTLDSIKLQACTLAKMTEANNQLTRTASMLAANKCQQLVRALLSSAMKISYEDVQTITTYIAQCATNVLTAINGPLQGRTNVLNLDLNRANILPDDYDTDLESEWVKANFVSETNDFPSETIEERRNRFYQTRMAKTVADQVNDIYSLITAALNIHLNIGQTATMDTSSVFVSMETISMGSLSNKLVEQIAGAQIRLPSNFNLTTNENTSISLRSIMQPLASSGSQSHSQTNLSTSVSLSLLDRDGNEVPIQTTIEQSIELIIPRDPNIVIPAMTFQNVTSLQNHNRSFHYHFVNITRSDHLTASFHFEMFSHDYNRSYWFIFKFDEAPRLNQSIDGWTLFCPGNLTDDDLYKYFIDNQRTSGHQSIIFGLRELNETEMEYYCSNISLDNSLPVDFDSPFNFTVNYEIRAYISGCYYLDANNVWQSDGLRVGPATNHYQTQCFSTHLTTFASDFLPLPTAIIEDYVFAGKDLFNNTTLYATIIGICVLQLLFLLRPLIVCRKTLHSPSDSPIPQKSTSENVNG